MKLKNRSDVNIILGKKDYSLCQSKCLVENKKFLSFIIFLKE